MQYMIHNNIPIENCLIDTKGANDEIWGNEATQLENTLKRQKVTDGHCTIPASLTGVSIHVQVLSTSEGKSEAGGNIPGSPLASDHLRWFFPEPSWVSIIDVDQSLLVLPSKRTADSHVCRGRKILDCSHSSPVVNAEVNRESSLYWLNIPFSNKT